MMTPGGEEWGLSGGLRSPGAGGRGSDPGGLWLTGNASTHSDASTHQFSPMRHQLGPGVRVCGTALA